MKRKMRKKEKFVTKGEKTYKHINPTGITRGWEAQPERRRGKGFWSDGKL